MKQIRMGSFARWGAGVLAVTAVLAATGCRTTPPMDPVLEEPHPILEERVVLSPGDVVDLKFFYSPELNETQTIRPDGKISLQLAGEVLASGLTPLELRQKLLDLYAPLIEKPEVAVIVRELTNRAVYVAGAVRTPGRVPMPGALTALEAVMRAGGLDPVNAKANEVLVIRHAESTPEAYRINIARSLEKNEQFHLRPQDIVFVPRTRIVNLNQWIDQHITKMVPQFGITFGRTSSDGRSSVGLDTSGR